MRCAEIRKAKGHAIHLADLVSVDQASISRVERGHDSVTLRLIRDVAQALAVSVMDLFAEERTAGEREVVAAFRELSEERQKGWLDLAQVLRGI